jgi:predicted Zn-dependent protease with MMP-like domain
VTREAFEALVRKTVEGLPEDFRSRLGDLAVVVRDEPSKAERRAAGVDRDDDLFGLFQGEATTEQSLSDLPRVPDRIVIYQRPLERAFPDPAELAVEIRTTILHELGHYFGLDERQMDELGYA